MATALSSSADCQKDSTYFIADGNVVLRVETTLFNVHRSCLIQASTVFADMLSLPQGEQRVEGQDVAHPVVLAGDTADEFRSLCWAIYTRPDQLNTYLKDMASALCKLAEFRGSDDVVNALFRVHLCDIEGFDSWAEPFIKRLADSSQPPMLIRMMRAAVTAKWKTLEYHTLYRLVSDGPNSWIGSAADLTHDETFRLLRGYFNMNEFVYKLPTIDLPFEHQISMAQAGGRSQTIPRRTAKYASSPLYSSWRTQL
ncbi:hypothetical protein EXIGLDRAFT_751059 [Exidia glandulosa HHB12029]|uniref:BTB domain-containing protein n=1 Tax=Exidia glandulosa HHB12029 TaxID=1314781 RepID=A0A165FX96_EXIGL|nr:hypothetical protein EXIGLDRAFT_751059 [Exidia glandulosa HHB12029]